MRVRRIRRIRRIRSPKLAKSVQNLANLLWRIKQIRRPSKEWRISGWGRPVSTDLRLLILMILPPLSFCYWACEGELSCTSWPQPACAQDIPWRFDLSPAGIVCSASVRRFLGLGEPACLFFRRVSELLCFRLAPPDINMFERGFVKLPPSMEHFRSQSQLPLSHTSTSSLHALKVAEIGTFQVPISATFKACKDEVEVWLCCASTRNAINAVVVSLRTCFGAWTHFLTHTHKHRSVVVMYTCYSWIFGHLFAGGTLDPTGGLVDKCRYDIVPSGSRHHRQSCRLKEAMERPLLSTDWFLSGIFHYVIKNILVLAILKGFCVNKQGCAVHKHVCHGHVFNQRQFPLDSDSDSALRSNASLSLY